MNLHNQTARAFSAVTLLLTACHCTGPMNVTEKMMWSTHPVATLKGEATAFIVNRRDAGGAGQNLPVVFTSAHVLETLGKGPLIIGLRRADGAGDLKVMLLGVMPPQLPGNERFYVRHPVHDLAAFSLPVPEETAALAGIFSALDEKKVARGGGALRAGTEVSFLGYPEVYPGTDGVFPILRSGRVATYPVGTPQAQGRFLIDTDVYPGDSGAPVFRTARRGRPELVGVITRRVGADAKSFSHLAIALDAKVIQETLQLLVEDEKRNAAATAP